MSLTRKAFTLIELLVVITIIVVLLALLVPAMDKAIYQAELAVCGANLKAVGSSVTVYAMDHKRYFPYRRIVREYEGVEVDPMRLTLASATPVYDDRTLLRRYVVINKMLQCPLTGAIDMEVSSPQNTYVYSTYAMWWSWQYRQNSRNTNFPQFGSKKGSFKLGDKFAWTDENGATNTFSVLAGDLNHRYQGGGGAIASHPDKDGAFVNWVLQDRPNPWTDPAVQDLYDLVSEGPAQAAGSYVTLSWWRGGGRGLLDVNFTLQDGSVRRFDNVAWFQEQDYGLRPVPAFVDDRTTSRHFYLPPN